MVSTGIIKFYAPGKYGFIKPDTGDRDVFIHRTEVEKAGYGDGMLEGTRVLYDLAADPKGRTIAVNLSLRRD